MATIQRSATAATLDGDRLLRLAGWCFTAAVLFHNGDHVRRGSGAVGDDVFWAGSLSILLEVAVVGLVFLGHRFAPLAAASAGFSLAAGYVLVHLLPGRSWLSDPLFDGGAEGVSQLAASFEIVAALALGAAGSVAVRQRGGLASASAGAATGSWTKVLTHPVVLVMALGHAEILVLSIAAR